ncbi:hypothetical protein Tco_1340975, partial [Tanacetum coccineum]
MYRSMIGSLMYLTSLRPDIMFAVCACARYQVNPKVSHLHAMKRIFRYLKGQPKLGLWYPKDSPFDLVAYTDSDYAGASLDRKSTTGGCQFLGCRLISWQCKKQTVVANSTTEAEYVAASSCWEVQLHALVDGKKIIITESTVRRDLQLEDAEDETVHKKLDDRLVRAATTASSLEAEQDSGGGSRCQETMGDIIVQTRFENVSKHSNDSLLVIGNTLRSDEDSLKLKELKELCTNLQQRVLDLEKTKTTQQNEIASWKRRVKKLEQKKRLRTHGLKRLHKVGMSRRVISSGGEEDLGEDASKQGRRINAIDADEDITLVNVQDDADNEMFDADTLNDDEVSAEQEVAAKGVNLTIDEVTLAQALSALKSLKPKVKGEVIEEPSVPVSADSASTKVSAASASKKVSAASASTKVSAATTTTTTIPTTITRSSQQPSHAEVQDKGKGNMIEPGTFDEEERLAREKDEANVALTEEWDDIQATIEADHKLAQTLQVEEQKELSVKEKEKLFQQLLEQIRKHFA